MNQPNLETLKSQLLTSGLQQSNPPLYQVIDCLIRAIQQFQNITVGDINNINSIINNITNNVNTRNGNALGLLLDSNESESDILIPGPKGDIGPKGIDGINGLMGIDGEDGTDGVNGQNGINGINGTNGTNGLNGSNGINGTDGEDGEDSFIPGPSGINGINGINGLPGLAGQDGEDGIDGFTIIGPRGASGLNGLNGIPGLDAEEPEFPYVIPGPIGPAGAGSSPPGSNTQVIFNDSGAFGADAGLTYVKATDALTLAGLFDISGAAAGQIKFPATQNVSSNVNTLDDYERGTWTPVGNGITFAVALGNFTKIGNRVFFGAEVDWPVTANAGDAKITGLPFTVENAQGARAGAISYTNRGVLTYFLVTQNTSEGKCYDAAGVGLTNAQMSNTTNFIFGMYNI